MAEPMTANANIATVAKTNANTMARPWLRGGGGTSVESTAVAYG